MHKYTIMTILGTRPEIIRLSRVLPALDSVFHHIFVYTNQNYDYELSGIFFNELQLRAPDHILNVKSQSLGTQIGNILSQTEHIMLQVKPDAVLILGDTNSALSAIIARRMNIPVFHMEAGNRCFDWRVPEEINRRIVDHISNFNICYTEHARRYLLHEGIDPASIFVFGSPLKEVIDYYRDSIEKSNILNKLSITSGKYFLLSIHREENVDNTISLDSLVNTLHAITKEYEIPIVVSLHPRTKKRLEHIHFNNDHIIFHKPFGFYDYNKLQKNALCVLSDSGTIQEESSILNFNAIQLRTTTERPEAFDAGSIIVCGLEAKGVLQAISTTLKINKHGTELVPSIYYQEPNVSAKVIKILSGMIATHLSLTLVKNFVINN